MRRVRTGMRVECIDVTCLTTCFPSTSQQELAPSDERMDVHEAVSMHLKLHKYALREGHVCATSQNEQLMCEFAGQQKVWCVSNQYSDDK